MRNRRYTFCWHPRQYIILKVSNHLDYNCAHSMKLKFEAGPEMHIWLWPDLVTWLFIPGSQNLHTRCLLKFCAGMPNLSALCAAVFMLFAKTGGAESAPSSARVNAPPPSKWWLAKWPSSCRVNTQISTKFGIPFGLVSVVSFRQTLKTRYIPLRLFESLLLVLFIKRFSYILFFSLILTALFFFIAETDLSASWDGQWYSSGWGHIVWPRDPFGDIDICDWPRAIQYSHRKRDQSCVVSWQATFVNDLSGK